MKLFVDTWGWLVLADRSERQHSQVTSFYAERTRRTGLVVTSDYVLNELLTIMFSRLPFESASRFADSVLRSPFITIEPDYSGAFPESMGASAETRGQAPYFLHGFHEYGGHE